MFLTRNQEMVSNIVMELLALLGPWIVYASYSTKFIHLYERDFLPTRGLGNTGYQLLGQMILSLWPLKNHGSLTPESHAGREAASLIRNYTDDTIGTIQEIEIRRATRPQLLLPISFYYFDMSDGSRIFPY